MVLRVRLDEARRYRRMLDEALMEDAARPLTPPRRVSPRPHTAPASDDAVGARPPAQLSLHQLRLEARKEELEVQIAAAQGRIAAKEQERAVTAQRVARRTAAKRRAVDEVRTLATSVDDDWRAEAAAAAAEYKRGKDAATAQRWRAHHVFVPRYESPWVLEPPPAVPTPPESSEEEQSSGDEEGDAKLRRYNPRLWALKVDRRELRARGRLDREEIHRLRTVALHESEDEEAEARAALLATFTDLVDSAIATLRFLSTEEVARGRVVAEAALERSRLATFGAGAAEKVRDAALLHDAVQDRAHMERRLVAETASPEEAQVVLRAASAAYKERGIARHRAAWSRESSVRSELLAARREMASLRVEMRRLRRSLPPALAQRPPPADDTPEVALVTRRAADLVTLQRIDGHDHTLASLEHKERTLLRELEALCPGARAVTSEGPRPTNTAL